MSKPTPSEIRSLSTLCIGRSLWLFDQIESTNTLALELGNDPANDGLAILAKAQSAGRGQYGRTWVSEPGSSVLLSVLLFPPEALRRTAVMTTWAAVAVGEVILGLTGLQAKIKWPNDVLVQGKKVCGILIEQRTTGNADFPLATVIGIGLNVTQTSQHFESARLPTAGSLFSISNKRLDSESVAEHLLHQLDEEYARLLEGDFNTLEAMWKWRLGLLGRQVIVETRTEKIAGRLMEVGFDGVYIEGDEGGLLHFEPERVLHLWEATR